MKTNKPEVVAWLHEARQDSDVITDKVRYVWGTPRGSMGAYSVPLIRLSDYEALADEYEKLRKDAERIDWIESQAKKSPTGISFDYHKYVEDGYILEHGFRFMRRHFASGFKDNIRKAIDAAMQEASHDNQ